MAPQKEMLQHHHLDDDCCDEEEEGGQYCEANYASASSSPSSPPSPRSIAVDEPSSPPPIKQPLPEQPVKQTKCYTHSDLEPFNLLDHPVWVFDVTNKAMWWANTSALKVWSADSLESLLARDFRSDMSDATSRRLEETMGKCAKGLRVSESWTFYPNGQGPLVCYITFSEMHVGHGRAVALVEGELLKAQETIDKSTLRAVEMLRHLPIPVGQFDAHGRAMDLNPESLHVFGGKGVCDEDGTELTQHSLLDRFVDKELGQQVLHQVVEEGIDYNDEVQQHTKQGIRWFAVKMRRSKDPVNGSHVILYSARDITALIEAKNNIIICANEKKEAQQANMAKSEFVAVMAHEIRTPLHQVLGFLELLGQTNLSPQQKEYANLMEHAASCLMTVINDLLDFTKLEAGKMKMENISLSIQAVASALLESVAPKAEEKKIRLTSHFDDRIPPLLGDPNRLRQLLINLLQNAVKFTPSGTISLQVNRLSDDEAGRVVLRFVVADTGIGIAADQHQNIFNKYQQANASISRHYGGTGLGLAICKIIVETLGGTIGVDSTVGCGSKFWFQISFDKASHAATETITSHTESNSFSSLHVLVAEDNKVSQKLVVAVLKKLGHRATVVETGLQAVEAVRRTKFDLVLMDVQMPEMDGIEATGIIRSTGWTKEILPILGLTADFRPADLLSYQAMGMNDCVGKPIRMTDLRNHLCKAVGQSCYEQ